jgi:C-terminal processing protease CtpA/Prc
LSASASEVLAGGLHDNCRAVVVGTTSFGKGKIQAVFGLKDGEGMTMTGICASFHYYLFLALLKNALLSLI